MRIPTYKSVYLYLTHACNVHCSFCYRKGLFDRNPMSTLGPASMSIKTADDILDFCFTKLKLDPKFTIYFWGGEPTINFKVIKHVMEKYPQMQFHTNTNGSLVKGEMLDYFLGNRSIGLTWSFGNCYEKYGGVRQKAEAEPGMLKLVRDNPNHNVNFMVVRYDKLEEDFDYIANNITHNITIDLATRFDHKEEDLERFAEQYFKLLQKYKRESELYKTLNPALHSNAYVREFGLKAQVKDFHFCRTGLERLFIDTAGGIWQCDNMYICQHNKLGTVYDGIDYSKLGYVWDIDENREKYLGRFCENCELYRQCPRNKCLGLNLEHMGDMFKPEPGYCAMNKVLFKVIKKYIELERSYRCQNKN
jgi:uncharacterized protein